MEEELVEDAGFQTGNTPAKDTASSATNTFEMSRRPFATFPYQENDNNQQAEKEYNNGTAHAHSQPLNNIDEKEQDSVSINSSLSVHSKLSVNTHALADNDDMFYTGDGN